MSGGWRDIATAKKDGNPILIALKREIPRVGGSNFAGLQFVARHPGILADGFDMGWNFAAPVGVGGFPDNWIAGWQPLDEHPELSSDLIRE